MSKIIYEIMHRENCVAQISTVGECKIYLEDFMPYDLMLEESNDFDKRIKNAMSFYSWCASRMIPPDRTYAKEILNSIGAPQSVTDRERAHIKKYGSERFKALLDGVGNALDFRLGRLKNKYDLKQDAQRLEYVKEAVNMLAERSNPTEQEVYAGRLAEETNISKNAIMTQLADAVKRSNSKRRWAQNQARLQSGEMHQISVPYSAGGSQALGVASAEQRLLAAMLREPSYIPQVRAQLSPEKFVLPQQKELYEAFLQCQEQGIEISLSTLRPFVSEEALNELSRLAAQYSDVNCTPAKLVIFPAFVRLAH